jgi:L-histidine N-alpha-methyltransferase
MSRTPANVEIEVRLDPETARATMAREVRDGLTSTPKSLPSKYFYDERGSRLFERITELPEYYLTRAEQALLDSRAGYIARRTGFEEIVELGSGAARKTRVLLDAGLEHGALRRYVPVDVSREIAARTARATAETYPELDVHALVADFERHLGSVPGGHRRLVAFLGSTIGNFEREVAIAFLENLRRRMRRDDFLLLGTDLVKDRRRLEAAYNDAAGVTAEFNRNILRVVNRNLDADFDPARFEHEARWNPERQRIESALRSHEHHTVRIAAIDLEISIARDERIHTEVSCKYTRASLGSMLDAAGFVLDDWIPDTDGDFALSLSRIRG